MLALVKEYLNVTDTSLDTEIAALITIAKNLASTYIRKTICIEEIKTEFGKIDGGDLLIRDNPVYSIEQLRVSRSYMFDTANEYDTPTVLYLDHLIGRAKLDQGYFGDYRLRYKSGYNYKRFSGESITFNSEEITLNGSYSIQDVIDYINDTNTEEITASYDEDACEFTFHGASEFDLAFSDLTFAGTFGFNVLVKSLLDEYDSSFKVSWVPKELQTALLIIIDKLFNMTKMTSTAAEFRKKRIIQQDGFQTEFIADDLPVEAKVVLDSYRKVFL